jgi:transposase
LKKQLTTATRRKTKNLFLLLLLAVSPWLKIVLSLSPPGRSIYGGMAIHGNDDTLTAEDMALGYKQQQRVEEAWRTMKSGLKRRPVFHWAPHRIHAHIAITVSPSYWNAPSSTLVRIPGATSGVT